MPVRRSLSQLPGMFEFMRTPSLAEVRKPSLALLCIASRRALMSSVALLCFAWLRCFSFGTSLEEWRNRAARRLWPESAVHWAVTKKTPYTTALAKQRPDIGNDRSWQHILMSSSLYACVQTLANALQCAMSCINCVLYNLPRHMDSTGIV